MTDPPIVLNYIWNRVKPHKDGWPVAVPEMETIEQQWHALFQLQQRFFGEDFELTPVAERDFVTLAKQVEETLLSPLVGAESLDEMYEKITTGQLPDSN